MDTYEQQLAATARIAVENGVDLDEFMKAAWVAYVESRPGLRAHLEQLQMLQELEMLRNAGRVGQA